MAPAGYAPLPNPRSQPDADRELNEAFESDGEDYDERGHTESSPFIRSQSPDVERLPTPIIMPGAYDFERDYDHPPPGSPPEPSTSAFPNSYGNTNGRLGATPERPSFGRPSFFRRAVGALLPQHYSQVPTEPPPARLVGGGTDNDGVFSNVMAKPSRAVQVQNESGEVYLVPEESQKDMPPTYREAQLDAVPQYWETTVHAPLGSDPNVGMIVDDLPTGSIVLFVATGSISYLFGFVGFLLTYLLHTTHAAKLGSRAGLGATLIHYGLASKKQELEQGDPPTGFYFNATSGTLEVGPLPETTSLGQNNTMVEELTNDIAATRDWASLVLITMGWFLLLFSIVGFYRVKRWEMSIQSSTRSNSSPATFQPRDPPVPSADAAQVNDDENTSRRDDVESMDEAEARFARQLIRAGII